MISYKNLKENYLARIVFVIIILLFCVFIFFKTSKYIMPFILAFLIASMLEPFIKLMVNKLKFKRFLAATIAEISFILISLSLLYILISRIIIEIKNLIVGIPDFLESTYSILRDFIVEKIDDISWLAPEFASSLDTSFSRLLDNVTNLISSLLTSTFVTATGIPKMIIFLIITLLASYFMVLDRKKIAAAFRKIAPKKVYDTIRTTRDEIFTAIFGWVKAQGILMVITFIVLYLSFNVISWAIPVIDIKYRLTLAFIIALVDAFPIMGTGTILHPWAIYSFATGKWELGICLVGLFLLAVVIRQTVEPRILGRQIGLHPLITLLSMYLGLQLIGFFGILLGPITALVVRNLFITIMKEYEHLKPEIEKSE
jgi:sporulation integral membrane protein YtvI